MIKPPGIMNRDAALLNNAPGKPSAQQLELAMHQQQSIAQSRGVTQMPQAIAAAQQDATAQQSVASTMATTAKEMVKQTAGPNQLPGTQGVLAMGANAPAGMDPRVAILQQIGMA